MRAMTMVRRAIAVGVVSAGAAGDLAAAPAHASEAPFGVLTCRDAEKYRVCDGGRVLTFDGVPLDVTLTLPADAGSDLPLVVVLTGYPARKASVARSYVMPSLSDWSTRGYAALTLATRGMTTSCGPRDPLFREEACRNGYTRLADSRYEVRDVQHLAGLLADQGIVDPRRIGVTGESYGGSQALQLAALRDRIRLPNGKYASWRSPAGRPMRIAAAVPNTTWHDFRYAFAPDGTPWDPSAPIGVPKTGLLAGFTALGATDVYNPPAGAGSEVSLVRLTAALAAGEPFPPEAHAMLGELREFHSAVGIEFDGRPAPTLLANGFNDDVFAVDEARRFANRVRAVPGGHVAELHGDIGHPRTTMDQDARDRLIDRTYAWMDRWLRGLPSPDAAEDVELLPPACPVSESPGPTLRARSWAQLAPVAMEVESADPTSQSVVSGAGDPVAGASVDPLGPALGVPGTGRCATTAVREQRGTATLSFRYRGAPIAGAPAVSARIDVTGAAPEYTQLAARLWDVDLANSTRTLLSRGFYRPRGDGRVKFSLDTLAYDLPADHGVMLELLGSDAPFGRPSNAPFTVEVSDLTLHLPLAGRPGADQAPSVRALGESGILVTCSDRFSPASPSPRRSPSPWARAPRPRACSPRTS